MMVFANPSFCLTIDANPDAVDEMHDALTDCAWTHVDHQFVVHFISTAANASLEHDPSSHADQSLYVKQFCSVTDRWLMFRVGPFWSAGDHANIAVYAIFNSSLTASRAPAVHAIRSYALGSTDHTLTLLGFPPLLQHHFHLFGSTNGYQSVMNNHGANQCHAEEGGVNCLIKRAPSDLAWFVRDHVGFSSKVFDVRVAGAVPLISWTLLPCRQQQRPADRFAP
jgi:hypothetical protein